MEHPFPPVPCGPIPSKRQWRWHDLEFYGFVHFTVNTFTDKEWGFGDESPEVFNPTDFDADQIASVAVEAGMRGLILTAKHHDGFCLWPSRHTEHSVRNSPWRNGKGDVVRELSDACARHGLLFGVYLSPWDRNHPAYGTPAYIEYYRNQLRELLREYGPLFEVWFDGANGGDGYYGGARETRTIDKFTYYDWENTWALVRELQPDAVIFSDAGPDVRWCGNERGEGGETNWCTVDTGEFVPGDANREILLNGLEGGPHWAPSEVDVSIRPGWFYHAKENDEVKAARALLDIYYQSVGRNACLNLNLPPDPRGRIHESDVEQLRAFRRELDAAFARDLAPGAAVSADNTRGNAALYAPANVADNDPATFWAANDGVTHAALVFDFGRETSFDKVLVREFIPLGQRVRRWAVQVRGNGAFAWETVAQATTVGRQRILRLPRSVTAREVRIVILDARACPAIQRVSLYG
ncbi:MAG: alpha-L-fucosidase [Kiritimatiellaeota bacterium]|nr:alpha-L-fucosidase [Kiritimatiellota bacterium]